MGTLRRISTKKTYSIQLYNAFNEAEYVETEISGACAMQDVVLKACKKLKISFVPGEAVITDKQSGDSVAYYVYLSVGGVHESHECY